MSHKIQAFSLIHTQHNPYEHRSNNDLPDDVGEQLTTINDVPLLTPKEEYDMATFMYEKKKTIAETLFHTGLAINNLLTLANNTSDPKTIFTKKEHLNHNLSTVQKIHVINNLNYLHQAYSLEDSIRHASALINELGIQPKSLLTLTRNYIAEVEKLKKAYETSTITSDTLQKTSHRSPHYFFEHAAIINYDYNQYIAVRNHFVQANRKLAFRIAALHGQKNLADNFALASEGLITAADNFDVTRSNKFSTYAVWWIIQRIHRNYQKDHIIQLPAHRIQNFTTTHKNLKEQLGRDPTDKELKDKDIQPNILAALRNPISLDMKNKENDAQTIFLTSTEQPPTKQAEDNDLSKVITEILDILPEREKYIITARFGIGKKQPKILEEIGKELGITRERVRQIQKNALDKIILRHGRKLKQLFTDIND